MGFTPLLVVGWLSLLIPSAIQVMLPHANYNRVEVKNDPVAKQLLEKLRKKGLGTAFHPRSFCHCMINQMDLGYYGEAKFHADTLVDTILLQSQGSSIHVTN